MMDSNWFLIWIAATIKHTTVNTETQNADSNKNNKSKNKPSAQENKTDMLITVHRTKR